jgi:hypothetical protein
MTSYEILASMYKLKGRSSRSPGINPLAIPRIKFLIDFVKSNNLPHKIDYFSTENAIKVDLNDPVEKYVNIYIAPGGIRNGDSVLVFLAHHDIVNLGSDNVLDNTASVCNLLDLSLRLRGKSGILIALTDAEEIVSFTSSGAKRLAKVLQSNEIKVKETINLELTAYGKNYWANKASSYLDSSFNIVRTPYSDSTVLLANGISSTCIGTLPDADMEKALKNGYCPTWSLCHSSDDKFENAVREDMEALVSKLVQIAS